MKTIITAESTIDLPKEILEQFNIKILPFTVILGEETFYDDNLELNQIFSYVDENNVLPKTSAVNEFQYKEFFEEQLKEYDAIVHFSLSSEISSAYSNAIKAADGNPNIHIIDTRSLSTGIALLAIYASKLANKGIDANEIVEKATKRIPFVQTSFVVNTLSYLYKGGRCSGLARYAALILRLKPSIVMEEGKMHADKTYIGRGAKVVKDYCRDILSKYVNPDKSIAFITSTDATPDMVEAAKEELTLKGFVNIIVTKAKGTICCHCGPKTLGILFLNDGCHAV